MIWQFLWNKIEMFGMLFLFLLIFSKAWQLALGKKISMGIGKIPELIGSLLKFLGPLLVSLLKGLWTVLKWIFWFIIDGLAFVSRALWELFKLLRDGRGA